MDSIESSIEGYVGRTIDEAIDYAEVQASACGWNTSGNGHHQLYVWLKELKASRERVKLLTLKLEKIIKDKPSEDGNTKGSVLDAIAYAKCQ